jgi:hypothetical protein
VGAGLQKQRSAIPRPLHLLFLGKVLANDKVHDRLR